MRQGVRQRQHLEQRAVRLTEVQRATAGHRDLQFGQRQVARTVCGRAGEHAGGLARVLAPEHLLCRRHGGIARQQEGAPLQLAQIVAARDDFLARVAALLEIDPADQLVVEHLRHELAGGRGHDRHHARTHFQLLPLRHVQRGQGAEHVLRLRGRADPQPAVDRRAAQAAVGQANHCGTVPVQLVPGLRRGVRTEPGGCRRTGQAEHGQLGAGIRQARLGAHHEHRQPLERRCQHVGAAGQPVLLGTRAGVDEAGEHAALRRAVGAQAGMGQIEPADVVAELSMEEGRRIRPDGADDAPVRQHAGAAGTEFSGLSRKCSGGVHPLIIISTMHSCDFTR